MLNHLSPMRQCFQLNLLFHPRMPVLTDHCTFYRWIYDNLMHISLLAEWPYESLLFLYQKRSEKQNKLLRKPGRKPHLFNTARGLSLPAQWPWPRCCPGLSMCWLPLPGCSSLIRHAASLESYWELRVRGNTVFGLHFQRFVKEVRHLHAITILFCKKPHRLKRNLWSAIWQQKLGFIQHKPSFVCSAYALTFLSMKRHMIWFLF